MDCEYCNKHNTERFQDIIKKPMYKNFYKSITKLATVKNDKCTSAMLVKDLIKQVNTHREEILNFFFFTFFACQEEKDLKKEMIRSILKHESIVIDQSVTAEGFRLKVSFEFKDDHKIGKYKGPTF